MIWNGFPRSARALSLAFGAQRSTSSRPRILGTEAAQPYWASRRRNCGPCCCRPPSVVVLSPARGEKRNNILLSCFELVRFKFCSCREDSAFRRPDAHTSAEDPMSLALAAGDWRMKSLVRDIVPSSQNSRGFVVRITVIGLGRVALPQRWCPSRASRMSGECAGLSCSHNEHPLTRIPSACD